MADLNLIPFYCLHDRVLIAHDPDALAKSVHERDLQRRRADGTFNPVDPRCQTWEKLDFEYRNSCRCQADHIGVKLRAIGLDDQATPEAVAEKLACDGVMETLAGMEHRRRIAELILSGWTACTQEEHDAEPAKMKRLKRTPDLIPYARLPEALKDCHRDAVRAIPGYLRTVKR